MNEKDNSKKRSIILLALSIISVFGIVIIWQIMAPFLIDNDNIYLKTVVSGEMLGTPEPHMHYMCFLSGLVLSILYRITGNAVPWFGLAMCVSFCIPMIIVLHRSLCAKKKVIYNVFLLLIFILVYCSFFYQYFAKTQYTLATGFVAAGALFLYYLLNEESNTKKYILSLIPIMLLSAWSLGMRDKAFFMTVPFFGMVFLGKLFDRADKENIKRILISIMMLGATIALVWSIDFFAYRSNEWKEYNQYNSFREAIFDYDGLPNYEENKELYEELDIKKSSYDAMKEHYNIVMDKNINKESFARLAEVSVDNRQKNAPSVPVKIKDVLFTIFRFNLLEYQDRPINILVYLIYLFVVVLALVGKKFKAFRDVAFILIARFFDWFYLVWNGRFPFRVTQIIYIAELVLLIAIILKFELWEIKRKKKEEKVINPVFIAMLLLVSAASIRFGIPVMYNNYESIKAFRKLSVSFEELEDYMEGHPDNFYFFDMSHLYYMEDTISFEKKGYENYIYMGSWLANSPWYNNKMREWGIDDPAKALLEKDNVYIVYQEVDFDTRDFLDYYFEGHYPGTSIEVVDTFVSSNGFKYEILKPKYN